MELLSLGDRVEPGRYRLHSRFRGAAAFTRGRERLVFLVDAGKPEGPVNIVARGVDFASTDSLEVGSRGLRLGGRSLPAPRRYRSSLGPLPRRPRALERNLAALEAALRRRAAPESLAAMLDGGLKVLPRGWRGPFLSRRPARSFSVGARGFLAGLRRRARAGMARLAAGDLAGGASALRGLGFGLTPGGDDVLAGYLLALHALRSAYGAGVAGRIRAIQRGARARNPFSRTFLRCAAEGRFFEPAKALARSLFAGGPSEVAAAAERLIAVGATSGADLAAGLLLGLTSLPRGEGSSRGGFLVTRPSPRGRGE